MKMMLAVVVMPAVMVAGAVPAFAQAAEITVTGVIKDEQDKADGTPIYGIQDDTTLSGTSVTSPKGYLLEGDYSTYVGQRITVHGIPGHDHEMRVLDVTWIE